MTQSSQVLRNAHETIIPYHVFKQLELHAVLSSLLPKRSLHGHA